MLFPSANNRADRADTVLSRYAACNIIPYHACCEVKCPDIPPSSVSSLPQPTHAPAARLAACVVTSTTAGPSFHLEQTAQRVTDAPGQQARLSALDSIGTRPPDARHYQDSICLNTVIPEVGGAGAPVRAGCPTTTRPIRSGLIRGFRRMVWLSAVTPGLFPET